MCRRSLRTAAFLLAAASFAPGQEITRISAPVIGKGLSITYVSKPDNVFLMYFAAHARGKLVIPGIGNTLFLDPNTFFVGYGGVVPKSGIHVQALFIPKLEELIGVCVAIQTIEVEFPLKARFSINAVDFCVSGGIGTVLFTEGTSTSNSSGNLEIKKVVAATAAAPTSMGLGRYAPQRIRTFGTEGFLPLVIPTFSTTAMADQHVGTGKQVSRDMRQPSIQHMVLPNGYDLYIIRDQVKPKEFALVSVHRASGVARELSGSRVADIGTSTRPASNYRDGFAFTIDGEIAVANIHDSTNRPTPNVGPPDRIFLIHTDFTKTWPNGKNVIDVSPAAGPDKLHTGYNRSLRFGNGRAFIEGEDPDGTSGAAAMWHGSLDGKPWKRLKIPDTGTKKPFIWSYSNYRQTADGKAGIFPIGGNTTSSIRDMDYIAITNINPTTDPTVKNITAFKSSTRVQTPGQSGVGSTSLRAAISPDGKNAAIIVGANGTASASIAIVPMDGSKAGSVAPFTPALFDPQVDTFGEVLWLTNSKLLFSAGTVSTSMDFYIHDIASTPTTINLTRTTTGAKTAPFTKGGNSGNIAVRGSFFSDNRKWFYFIRGFTSTSDGVTTNVVGIKAATNELFDVTGKEFSSGGAPDIRAVSSSVYTWQWRRHPVTNEMLFIAAKDTGNTATRGDDEIWRFNPEFPWWAVQLTANNGSASSTSNVQRINDMVIQQNGALVAYSQGKGTSSLNPEDVFVTSTSSPAVTTQLSKTPVSGGQGIRRGSIRFTVDPSAGLAWIQGTNSRTTPSVNVAAYWNILTGSPFPLLLSTPPKTTSKQMLMINASK